MNLADTLRAATSIAQVLEHEPMARHTTMRVGGPAEILFSPAGEGELLFAVREAKRAGAPFRIIGNGSNLLVLDGGLPGLTIRLGEAFSKISVDGNQIRAQAGALLSRVAAAARDASLTGLEFASGIPGSAGGGMAMNAGAYGGQLSDVFEGCRALDPETGIISALGPAEMALGYRESAALSRGLIVTEAAFRLTAGDRSAIQAKMDDLSARRREKQPLNLPSAGSTFKRPEGHFAGALIEQCELKGCTIGGAQVSEKHAGFIVNVGDATAADILNLIEHVQRVVRAQTGVHLETEVRVLGEN